MWFNKVMNKLSVESLKPAAFTLSPLLPNTLNVFNAGVGNDTIIINASNITALEQTGAGNCARVDGGGGIDTLQLEGAAHHRHQHGHSYLRQFALVR
jgi:hypothetical protein